MWVTKTDLLRLIGVNQSRIDQIRRRCDARYDHGKGKDLLLYAPGLIANWVGTESDHAERLKKAQADIAELKLREMCGELVSRAEIAAENEQLGSELRGAIEKCCPADQDRLRKALESLLVDEENEQDGSRAKRKAVAASDSDKKRDPQAKAHA